MPDGTNASRGAPDARRPRETATPVVAAKLRVPPTASLRRERLDALLDGVWQRRLAVVVAPAGSGKTTLLSGFASAAGVPVAWYRAESWDADETTFLRHLEATLRVALPDIRGDWRRVEDAATAIDACVADRALLIIDDAHELEGTIAEGALERLVEYAPSWLAIVVGTRVAPGFNLSRMRVADELVEIGPDELRFRAWEVERLFRDHYGDPIPPGDLAILARRTEGWAAGLQLFHLATRGKSADERRRILTAVGSSTRLVREYLTWNVMADLGEDLRGFLVDTCVLGRLTGPLCDRLLDRQGSAALLDELFRRQIFTVELDDADGSYRYHEVFRSHLDRMLVERLGEAAARDHYRRAGLLLEEAGAPAEALGAFSRAEDWAAVRRLLGGAGALLAEGGHAWIETLPPAIVRHEPWLELAAARRARAEGRWSDALDAYARAEAGFGTAQMAVACLRERQSLRAWLEPGMPAGTGDWTRIIRLGVHRDPAAATRDADRQEAVPPGFVRGVLALAAGDVERARIDLAAARSGLEDQPFAGIAAAIALGAAKVLAGDEAGLETIGRAQDAAERAGAPWLARIAGVAARLSGEAGANPVAFDPDVDPWGAGLASVVEAWNPGPGGGSEAADRRTVAGQRAAALFHRLGAAVPEAWARALVALGLAETGAADAREAAIAAEGLARAAGASGPRLIAYRALALADPSRRDDFEALAASVARETGLADPPPAREPEPTTPPEVRSSDRAPERVVVTTFGGFAIVVDGVALSLDPIRPRARSLLRLLAIQGGAPVHREVIADALWPEADAQTAARSLQVAVSAIRGRLSEGLGDGGGRLLVREGDAYRLAVGDELDIRRFEGAIRRAIDARRRGESPAADLAAALALYRGDLIPEEGPAEWAVEQRDRLRAEAVDVARELAEVALRESAPRVAVDACRVGISIDRYHDPLWRLLIDARVAAGDPGAADRDRRDYEAILAELGVPVVASASS